MKIDSLARYLDFKYTLNSFAAEPLSAEEKILSDARRNLKASRNAWLDGRDVKDQSILAWTNDKSNKGFEFELMRELIHIIKNLSVQPAMTASEMYEAVQRGFTITKYLKDGGIKDVKNAMILADRSLTKPAKNIILHQAVKVRTFIRMSEAAFDNVKKTLNKIVPKEFKAEIDDKSVGGYSKQTPGEMTEAELIRFPWHPKAALFGLDNKEFYSELLGQMKLRPLVERLIRAVKRGHSPRAGAQVLKATDSLKELERKLITNSVLFETEEDKFQKAMNIVPPAEEWNRGMQDAQKQKALENEDRLPEDEEAQSLELLQKERDDKYLQRQQELQQIEEDRERHLGKNGSIVLRKKLLKRYL